MPHGSTFDATLQATLVSAAAAGDADAIGALYDSTFAAVYAYASRIADRREDAEDITSETYERAIRTLHRYRSGERPITVWLLNIARQVAAAHIRKRQRLATVPLSDYVSATIPDQMDNIDARALELGALTPAQREVIALRLAGFKIREIAGALGKAEGTIKALQFAAARRLREP